MQKTSFPLNEDLSRQTFIGHPLQECKTSFYSSFWFGDGALNDSGKVALLGDGLVMRLLIQKRAIILLSEYYLVVVINYHNYCSIKNEAHST